VAKRWWHCPAPKTLGKFFVHRVHVLSLTIIFAHSIIWSCGTSRCPPRSLPPAGSIQQYVAIPGFECTAHSHFVCSSRTHRTWRCTSGMGTGGTSSSRDRFSFFFPVPLRALAFSGGFCNQMVSHLFPIAKLSPLLTVFLSSIVTACVRAV
jgi:hypothetical protein